ncbi:hypothetical protein CCACVL1_27780 [Corchorus capsularis]|uniref:Uncharacterized protein n=1 Tax=Corchorus capsularis TaxID=210143 RepID=A0A1R3G8T0_COCAP|nr:hypothetical protein CCACVL1_27780 [Corchorus capsularis]
MAFSSSRNKSNAFASSTSSFASRSSTFFARATSPTRVNLYSRSSSPQSSPSVRFSINDRPISPGRSISFNKNNNAVSAGARPPPEDPNVLVFPYDSPGFFPVRPPQGTVVEKSSAQQSPSSGNVVVSLE